MEIYYDSYNEGIWFQNLHASLSESTMIPFPSVGQELEIDRVLAYDRPDIVLMSEGKPLLVVERTVEVPSGHNVGQRFARLVAAAQNRVPLVYFAPYAAYKHGGATAGPRYMNLRLFHALNIMAEVERTAVTTVRWPVDQNYEILQTPAKDERMRAYMDLFFESWAQNPGGMAEALMESEFEAQQEVERVTFAETEVVNPDQYDEPPASVWFSAAPDLLKLTPADVARLGTPEAVVYRVGMNYLRSDPYTGMAMLYAYLYCGGMTKRKRALILDFPGIQMATWRKAASATPGAKHIRLFRLVADGIRFADGYIGRSKL